MSKASVEVLQKAAAVKGAPVERSKVLLRGIAAMVKDLPPNPAAIHALADEIAAMADDSAAIVADGETAEQAEAREKLEAARKPRKGETQQQADARVEADRQDDLREKAAKK